MRVSGPAAGENLAMHDIRLALGLIGFLSVGVFLGLRRLLRTTPPRTLDAIAVGLVLLMAAYVKWMWGQLWIVNWIPLPSVIVLSNWFPLLLAAMGATVWIRLGGEQSDEDIVTDSDGAPDAGVVESSEAAASSPDRATERTGIDRILALRRTLLMVAIIGGAIGSVMYFVPTSAPQCENVWADPVPPLRWPVCRQTTDATCSAAAAATILLTLGIETTEQEMAELCLTRRGTTWLGLYHGLSTKLLWTSYKAEFFESTIDELPALNQQHPLLLCCRLDSETAEQAPEYVTQDGWHPGTAHSVVYFGRLPAGHIIGDPSRGYELWSDEDLKVLWTGEGLRIKDRPRRGGAGE